MEFSVKSGSPEKQRSACIVVGVFEPRRLSPIAEQLDKISVRGFCYAPDRARRFAASWRKGYQAPPAMR